MTKQIYFTVISVSMNAVVANESHSAVYS